jgi:pimeloyl-ACP methyl ester carboxylesterase
VIITITTGNRLPGAFVDQIVQHSIENSTPEAVAAYLTSWANTDISRQVKGHQTAIKVIIGEHDPAMSVPVMEQTWLKFYPGAELEVLSNAGHFPMYETPAALAASIEEFLGRV